MESIFLRRVVCRGNAGCPESCLSHVEEALLRRWMGIEYGVAILSHGQNLGSIRIVLNKVCHKTFLILKYHEVVLLF